jgi:dihydrofolate reductase
VVSVNSALQRAGDMAELAARARRGGRDAPGRDILVLIQALLRADLVDELRLNVLPAAVGGGLRLLAEGLPRSSWQLVGALTFETGAVGLHYRRAR